MQAMTGRVEAVSKLAHDRGYKLSIQIAEDMPLYWVENHIFIGKPYTCLEALTQFIHKLPNLPSSMHLL